MSEAIRPRADSETLWREHGWGLRGWHVALLVAVVVAASVVVQLVG